MASLGFVRRAIVDSECSLEEIVAILEQSAPDQSPLGAVPKAPDGASKVPGLNCRDACEYLSADARPRRLIPLETLFEDRCPFCRRPFQRTTQPLTD